MLIIPAVDIKNGKCVRLLQGDKDRETVYSNSPIDIALKWQDKGADLIHIVDLDGAFDGIPQNLELIKKIRKSLRVRMELGGGIRDEKTLDLYIESGIDRIIIGSKAYTDENFVNNSVKKYKEKIIVGIDCVDKKVAINGWKTVTDTELFDFSIKMQDIGVKELIVTDISKDGMLTGINTDFYHELLEKTNINIIASGGVSTIEDIRALLKLNNKRLTGVILGKSLYEGTIELEKALKAVVNVS